MKKQKIFFRVTTILIILLLLTGNGAIFAIDSANLFRNLEYSEEYKRWLELPEEQRKKVIQPRMYEVPYTNTSNTNPMFRYRLFGASNTPNFNLKDRIPANIKIKDQRETGSCWAFASISSLETNLALANLKSGKNTTKVYDYSERHMDYATSSDSFIDGTNEDGYKREVDSGGNWYYVESYLTNGTGAINEAQMPFENYNIKEKKINLADIKNKNVTSQIYDTVEFANYMGDGVTTTVANQIKNQIKQHIQDYGSVFATIYGDGFSDTSCYNIKTGALYCKNSEDKEYLPNHAISIVGWDDTYAVKNFNEGLRPQNPGAWIIRNSWGEKAEIGSVQKFRDWLFNQFEDSFREQNITNSEDIPADMLNNIAEHIGYIIEDDYVYMPVGDNGYMYVSYEDCNISTGMYGIVKAKDYKNYENIYQYDEFTGLPVLELNAKKVFLGNIFERKTTGKEYLNQVSIHVPQRSTCKVFVNPNGKSLKKSDLQEVTLKAGTTETFDAGYHTLEFENPIELNSSFFAIAVEIQTTGTENIVVSMEINPDGIIGNINLKSALKAFENVQVEKDKCFIGMEDNNSNIEWTDLGKISSLNFNLVNGDSTIKAFTSSKIIDESVKKLEIVTPPTKTKYLEGENFDKTGMVVKVYYNNDTSEILDEASYNISNGTALKAGQTSVTISYENKSVEQPITVEKNSAVELKIKTPPTKTKYKEGEDFDKTGMVVEAKFKDGTTKTITDYKIENGNALKLNQASVTISYDSLTVTQTITVEANPLISISVTKEPTKTKYIVGQDFDKTGMVITASYESGLKKNVEDYTIEDGQKLKKSQELVTIKYKEKVTAQKIIVEDKAVTQITIDKKPTKLSYIKDKEELDLTGGTIKATYNDGTTEIVEMKSENVKIEGFSNKTAGKVTITVTYQNKNATFDVEIVEPKVKTLTQITIDKKPTKLKYIKEKEELDLTGGTIKATYDDGTTEIVEMKSENVKINGFSNKTVGKVTITVTYQNKNTTFDVEIIEQEVKEEEKPQNTNFDKSECQLIDINMQYDSNKPNEAFSYIKVEISNILSNKNNDNVEYYYHVSSEANEKNINVWTKITEEQKEDNKLIFTIDLKNLPNDKDISNDGKIYIYIKEVAVKGGNQSVAISKGMELKTDKMAQQIEKLIDSSKKEDEQNVDTKQIKTITTDSTTSNAQLPKTGIKKFLIIISLCVGIFGIFGYIRYKKMARYIK